MSFNLYGTHPVRTTSMNYLAFGSDPEAPSRTLGSIIILDMIDEGFYFFCIDSLNKKNLTKKYIFNRIQLLTRVLMCNGFSLKRVDLGEGKSHLTVLKNLPDAHTGVEGEQYDNEDRSFECRQGLAIAEKTKNCETGVLKRVPYYDGFKPLNGLNFRKVALLKHRVANQ
uniref:Uncharacterized protein n=1 Tax=Romanomermis culicivorax TaxID=13658 RepID=A0A915INK1_ROMCU